MTCRILCFSLAVGLFSALSAEEFSRPETDAPSCPENCFVHPWQGKKVGYLGDSITDPKSNPETRKYWDFLKEWLGITPYVYAVGGRQWNDIPRQAEALKREHGGEVDAIVVLIGTNDYHHGLPVGEWYEESMGKAKFAEGKPMAEVARKQRRLLMNDSTFCGRINKGLSALKSNFPDKQIVLLTPLHRAFAMFGPTNVQPDESFRNGCGEYIDAYVQAIKEAGNVWSVPVIDLNAVSGMNPTVEEQKMYFVNPETDLLHPSTAGQERMARTLMYQLLAFPVW